MNAPPPAAVAAAPSRPGRWRRALLWTVLLALLGVAQSLLVLLSISYESSRAQEDAERAAAETAGALRREVLRQMQALQTLALRPSDDSERRQGAQRLLQARQGLERLEWRSATLAVQQADDTPFPPRLFELMPRAQLAVEAELACAATRRLTAPAFSRSYFVPLPGGSGVEVLDLCIPLLREGRVEGYLVGTFSLNRLLELVVAGAREGHRHEFSVVEPDGTRLARSGLARGTGTYVAQQVLDLPGAALQLRADAAAGRPGLIPNLTTALVLGLSLALFGVVALLARDGRRRAQAERALAEALAFRKAMEDSLPTGLRARDRYGTVTYANPAFCAMVGFSADELRQATAAPDGVAHAPYWPPEYAAEYQRRQALRLQGLGRSPAEARAGYETVFMRKNGERFPVMVFEAPLVDADGRHTGWMSAVHDLTPQRKVEEISRQQQERLQASARLATVGEMASLLSHELNQPLAAIASYATGSLNLIDEPADPALRDMLRQALQRIAEQADRAGRVIKSVHSFVRRREQQHETLGVDQLFGDIMPLVRLQARKSGTRIEIDLPERRVPRVRCDRTMVEQVLLNLARNGIQAMEGDTPVAERVLVLRARQTHERWVTFDVIDAGSGIAPEVAQRLFTPFFTTRTEGMGLGLSLCRTVIEQHGGALDFAPGPGGRGTAFRFTLPTGRGTEPGPGGAPAGEKTGDTSTPAAAD